MRKKQTNDEKIIAAMDALDESIIKLQKFAASYDEFIDEAAISGDDARAKELIKQKIRVNALVKQLKSLNSSIKLGVCTSQAMAQLGKLPAAIAGCKGLLAESPDFVKLGKSIEAIFKDIGHSEQELAKLNDILNPKPAPSVESRLAGSGSKAVPQDETTDAFKAEYAAMIERVKRKVEPEPIVKPAAEAEDTGDIDYEGIVAEENKRKD